MLAFCCASILYRLGTKKPALGGLGVSDLALPASAGAQVPARLLSVRLHRQPLQVVHGVGAAANQGLAVINLPAWAGPGLAAG